MIVLHINKEKKEEEEEYDDIGYSMFYIRAVFLFYPKMIKKLF
jgi:hypothetical protein